MWQKVEDVLLRFSGKISRNVVLQVLSQSFVNIFPFLMIGSIFSLLSGVPVTPWQSFLSGTGLSAVLAVPLQYTTEAISIYIAFIVTYNYCSKKKAKKQAVIGGLTSVFAFLCLNPLTKTDGGILVSFNYLGSKGLFVAIISAFAVGEVIAAAVRNNWKINMPDSVPPYVANSFSALIPAVIVSTVYIIINYIFSFTSYGNVMDAFYAVMQAPMSMMHNGPGAMVILEFVSWILWWFGIHGGNVTSPARNGFFLEPRMENLAAYSAGQPLPNIITGQFLTVSVLPFVIVILLFCKSKRIRSVGKIAFIPSLFMISEPLNFGLPIILNPIMLIPLIFTYPISVIYTYFLNVIGWLPYSNGVQIQSVPGFIQAFFRYGGSGVFWWVVLFVLLCAFVYPFMKLQDKKYLEEEQMETEKAEN